MNSSIPKRLIASREFRALGTLARIVVRLLWRRGEEGCWPGDELLTELQTRGLFLGRAGIAEFEPVREELLGAGALVYDPETDEHTMPILSGDRARDARSETAAARRKREQRDRDRQDPERVAARRALRHAPSVDPQTTPPSTAPERSPVEPPSACDTGRDNWRDTPPCHTPNVTVTGHVTGHVTSPVTVTPSGGERGGEENSSSSSSFSEGNRREQRVTAPAREGAGPVTPVTGGVTPPVTPSVTGGVTPGVTGDDLVRAFIEHAPHRVNTVAPARILTRASELLVELRVTRDELVEMARRAGRGELLGQAERACTDLTLLVGGRQGEGALLAAWAGATRTAMAAASRERGRLARDAEARQRALPYGAGVARGAAAERPAERDVGPRPVLVKQQERADAEARAARGERVRIERPPGLQRVEAVDQGRERGQTG